jgi:hypothetical protein
MPVTAPLAKRAQERPGVGPIIASAIVASVLLGA